MARESITPEDAMCVYNLVNHASVAWNDGLLAQLVFGLPSTRASNIELVILGEVQLVVAMAGGYLLFRRVNLWIKNNTLSFLWEIHFFQFLLSLQLYFLGVYRLLC